MAEEAGVQPRTIRVLVVSAFQPRPFNLAGPEALLFDLLRFAPGHVVADVIRWDRERQCFVRVETAWPRAATDWQPRRGKVAGVRWLPRALEWAPRVAQLDSDQLASYDAIWCYPSWMAPSVPASFPGRLVISGMDSATLLFLRACSVHRTGLLGLGCRLRLLQATRFEASLPTSALIHVVGAADARMFSDAHGRAAIYVPHPHSSQVTPGTAETWRGAGRLRVVFAGALGRLYTGDLLDHMLEAIRSDQELLGGLEVTFVGRGFNEMASRLAAAGGVARAIPWVDDFHQELKSHHVMVVPLAVGAGTKNRVLAAISAGLDCIGTPVAFENIEMPRENRLFERAEEIVPLLKLRLRAGRSFALDEAQLRAFAANHDPCRVATEFWGRLVAPAGSFG